LAQEIITARDSFIGTAIRLSSLAWLSARHCSAYRAQPSPKAVCIASCRYLGRFLCFLA
jgi:hypothetical protein